MKAKVFLISTALLLMITSISSAVPADPYNIMTMDINGEMSLVRQWGDEFAHGFETFDGFTIIKNKADGIFYYAALDDTGKLIPSE